MALQGVYQIDQTAPVKIDKVKYDFAEENREIVHRTQDPPDAKLRRDFL
jgi:hypothetical protein